MRELTFNLDLSQHQRQQPPFSSSPCRLAVGLGLLFIVVGCEANPSTNRGSTGQCAPNTTQSCVCDDGSRGTRRCEDEGIAEPCMCRSITSDGGVSGPEVDSALNAVTDRADAMAGIVDQMVPPVDAEIIPNPDDIECNSQLRRAVLPGTFRCDGDPEYVEVDGADGRYQIFSFEASHPLSSRDAAHPCAAIDGPNGQPVNYEAPDEPTEACSQPDVRPWHTVTWKDAQRACEFIGWRLCSRTEFLRACGGEDGRAFPYGSVFRDGVCNVRDAFRNVDSLLSSEAPTGYFDECLSTDRAYDMTGNLWEWTDEREEGAPGVRFFMGMGYKTIAERHQDYEMRCDVDTRLNGSITARYVNETVGFRCCRSIESGNRQ